MIYYVTGLLGHGKSLYAVRRMCRALMRGRVVVSNIHLVDGWEHEILRHDIRYKVSSRKQRERDRFYLGKHYFFTDDFEVLTSARITGYGEGRGLRVFDEAHNRLNNRDWKEDNQKTMLRRLTLSRKRGWNDLIISQHAKNTDVAIRRIADAEVRVTDWQKLLAVPVFNWKLLPFHLFLALEFPIEETATPGIQSKGQIRRRELYTLGWWRKCYDTFEDYELEGEDVENALWMPLPAPQLRTLAGGAARPVTRSVGPAAERPQLESSASGGLPSTDIPPDAA